MRQRLGYPLQTSIEGQKEVTEWKRKSCTGDA